MSARSPLSADQWIEVICIHSIARETNVWDVLLIKSQRTGCEQSSALLPRKVIWASDAVERTLAHIEGNEVRRAYVGGELWEERIRMANWWANELDQMKNGTVC
jgi:hypothetical protein